MGVTRGLQGMFRIYGTLVNTNLYAYPFGHRRDVTPGVMKECSQSVFTLAVMNEYNSEASDFHYRV